jgi:hypothetical protein
MIAWIWGLGTIQWTVPIVAHYAIRSTNEDKSFLLVFFLPSILTNAVLICALDASSGTTNSSFCDKEVEGRTWN